MTGKNETIVDRVVQRLQTQPLGDLITEEDLHDIVKQAIPKAFFEPRFEIVRGSWNSNEKKELQPLIVEMATTALKSAVQTSVDNWMAANADKLGEAWRPIFEKSVEKWLMERHAEVIKSHAHEVLRGVFNHINQQRQSQGLPPYMY